MGKAEEYLAKKRNKAARKRTNNTVDFSHGVHAAKRRRKAGRRRICEGMCFSLPTPEDPFNDLHKEKLSKKKGEQVQTHKDNALNVKVKTRKAGAKNIKENDRNISAEPTKFETAGCNAFLKESESKCPHVSVLKSEPSNHSSKCNQNAVLHRELADSMKHKWKPSGENCFTNDNMWMCIGGDAFEVALCTLVNAGRVTIELDEDYATVGKTPLLEKRSVGSKWDWLLWETCGTGSDVLVTGQAVNKSFQTDCVLAAVAHIAARRVAQILFKDPIVLFIVQSKQQTLEVRNIFKVLKPCLSLHAISLHPQTALEHQIEGLSSTNAEVLIATPRRLCELVSVNAVSLKSISFMVVNAVEQMVSCGFESDLMHIRKKVGDNVQVVLSSVFFPHNTHSICQKLQKDPIYRVTTTERVPEYCACISQKVYVLVSEDKRQQKLKNILSDCMKSQSKRRKFLGPVIVFKQLQSLSHVKDVVQEEGYMVTVLCGDSSKASQPVNLILEQYRNGKVDVLLASEDCLKNIDLAEMGIIVLYEFATSVELYRQILMKMARHTISGVLHSFCSGVTAPLASELINVLQECLQPIPPSLQMLADAARVVATTAKSVTSSSI